MLTARNKQRAKAKRNQHLLPKDRAMHRKSVDMSGKPNYADWTPMTAAEMDAVEMSAKRDNPSRGRLPTWGQVSVLAVYGTEGADAVCRRKCKVQPDTRFPYLQSPV